MHTKLNRKTCRENHLGNLDIRGWLLLWRTVKKYDIQRLRTRSCVTEETRGGPYDYFGTLRYYRYRRRRWIRWIKSTCVVTDAFHILTGHIQISFRYTNICETVGRFCAN